MIQIPDAPYIREAELNGFPLEDYEDDYDYDDDFCPLFMPWLSERRNTWESLY